jgi:beta-mannosidase
MTPRLGHRPRTALQGWALCAALPGETQSPDAMDARWLPIEAAMPVAAALRSRGQWHIDGPAQHFDAQDWWYRAVFALPPGECAAPLVLGCDGLATHAQAWLNGQPLLDSSNMFVAHACALDAGQLRPHGNVLVLHFKGLDALLSQRRPRPRWRTPMLEQQQLRWWRTTLLGRTPGWSPPCAVVGPWKDVWLTHARGPGMASLLLDAHVAQGEAVVHCRVTLDTPVQSVLLQLERQGRVHAVPLQGDASACSFEAQASIPQAQLWWPHTHGEPALYAAQLQIRSAQGEAYTADLGSVGFRSIVIDRAGGDFALSVNGVPVFCRGAVWTPLDPVTLHAPAHDYTAALEQVRTCGMNMLRVPGTGVYEDDAFYAACDAAGVLVWQDLMFASMDYPGEDPGFIDSITTELRRQLPRLRSHACLALLCGNSEVEQQAAMWGAPRALWQPALFHRTMAALCRQEAPAIAYWPSSTHGGDFPHQADQGTTSYYGVGAYQRPLDDARRSGLRFASECLAFANIPEDAALARMPGGLDTRAHHPAWKQRSPRDLGAGWDFDDVRDHYLQRLVGLDPAALRASDHGRYLALGRLATAQAMEAAFSEWRRPGSRCRGALVLALRDLWAGAGWGLLDDAGVPKAAWHALRRVLQPVALLISDEGLNGLHLHLVNETPSPIEALLEIAAWQDGQVQVARATHPVTLEARAATSLSTLALFGHFMDLGHAWRFGPPMCDVVAASLRDAQGQLLGQAFHFPAGLPLQQRGDLGLAVNAVAQDDGSVQLDITSGTLALGVTIEAAGWQAQDQMFHLAPGGRASVRLHSTGANLPAIGWVQALNARQGLAFTALPASPTLERAA